MTKPQNDLTGALSVTDFLRRYSVGRTLFYRLVNSGALPVRKVGTKTLIRVSDAEAWAANLPVKQAANERVAA